MTEADKLWNYLEPLSLPEFRDFCKECGIDVPPVIYEPRLTDYKRDVFKAALALQEREPVRWTRVMRAAGIRMYDPKTYAATEPFYLEHRRDLIENWGIYPAVKHQGKRERPEPVVGVNGVWRLGNKPRCRDVPHPFEFEEFLRRDRHFQTSEQRAGDGSLMYELSHVGMRKRRWIDWRKRRRKWARKTWDGVCRTWKASVDSKKSPVLSYVIKAIVLAAVSSAAWYLWNWLFRGQPLSPDSAPTIPVH